MKNKFLIFKSFLIMSLILSMLPATCFANDGEVRFNELLADDSLFVGLPAYDHIKSKNPNMKVLTLLGIYKSIGKQIGDDTLKNQIWINYVTNNDSIIMYDMNAKQICEKNKFYRTFVESMDSIITNLSTMSDKDLLRLVFTGRGEADAMEVLNTCSNAKLRYILNISMKELHPEDYEKGSINLADQIDKDLNNFYKAVNEESARYDNGLFDDDEFEYLLNQSMLNETEDNATTKEAIMDSLDTVSETITAISEGYDFSVIAGGSLISGGITMIIGGAIALGVGIKAYNELDEDINVLNEQIVLNEYEQGRLDGLEYEAQGAWIEEPSKSPDSKRLLNIMNSIHNCAQKNRDTGNKLKAKKDEAQANIDNGKEGGGSKIAIMAVSFAGTFLIALGIALSVVGSLYLHNASKVSDTRIHFMDLQSTLYQRLSNL